jgi:hypothetical protein
MAREEFWQDRKCGESDSKVYEGRKTFSVD